MILSYFDPFRRTEKLMEEQYIRAAIDTLTKEFSQGNGKSAYMLALLNNVREDLMPLDLQRKFGFSEEISLSWYRKAFPLLISQAEELDTEAMHFVAIYYQCGIPPVAANTKLMETWTLRAKYLEGQD